MACVLRMDAQSSEWAVMDLGTGFGEMPQQGSGMKKALKSGACVAALFFMLAGCAAVPKKPDTVTLGDYTYVKEYVSWLAHKEMNRYEISGLSLALVDDQRVVWAEGFGYADEAGKVPASPETGYRVGSISKLFTTTAIMQLVEQGKMDIDQPLQSYLPDLSVKSRFPGGVPITPRMIMTHHSGLPSDIMKGIWSKSPEPFENGVTLIRKEYAPFPPNFIFSYSNIGMSILGHALEKVTGRDFASHIKSSLLEPLGMNRSSFHTAGDSSLLGAKSYRKGKEVEEVPLRDVPAGGLNASVLDLSRFMRMLFAGGKMDENRILKQETVEEMFRPQNKEVPLDLNFYVGLGWMLSGLGDIDIKNAGVVAHHVGSTLGHRGMLIVLPEHKLGVVVFANSATGRRAVNKVAAEALKLALEAKTGIQQPETKAQVEGEGFLSQDELRPYGGRYATFVGVADIMEKTGYLQAEVMHETLRLVPRPGRVLGLQYKLLGLISLSLDDLDRVSILGDRISGRDILKARIDGKEMLIGERIEKAPIPEKWLKCVGEYEIANLDQDAALIERLRLRHDQGYLVLDYSLPIFFDGIMTLILRPLSDTEAIIGGLGRGMGETIRLIDVNGEDMLQYSGYLLKKKSDDR